jgi:glutaredoxin 3
MYSTTWCGYCIRAKALLDRRGLEYEEIVMDDDPAFRQKLLEMTGRWTVPQIFIDDVHVGGYTSSGASTGRPPRRARGLGLSRSARYLIPSG